MKTSEMINGVNTQKDIEQYDKKVQTLLNLISGNINKQLEVDADTALAYTFAGLGFMSSTNLNNLLNEEDYELTA